MAGLPNKKGRPDYRQDDLVGPTGFEPIGITFYKSKLSFQFFKQVP